VLLEKSLGQLEERLKSGRYAALILDIMFQVPGGFRSIEDGRAVSSSAGGMEILRRCRNGYYGSVNKEIPIFIRSARGEAHIAALCKKLGANGYFQVGIHDSELIDALTGGLTGAS
jgi:CheY-like chemotaxis protein